jgi:hypothetical protein
MLPQKTTILALMMATLMTLGSLSLIPLDVYASHSYEAGVQGDNIPDNTHIDLSQLTLPSTGVLPLYDSSPNFISGHFLLRAPCDDTEPPKPLATVIAGHIDESENLTHVDKVPLYFVGHASTAGSCVYHAHLPDPLEGGSPRVTDVDLVNYSPNNVTFNAGDAVDINIQRSLGNIGNFYEGNVLLPLQLSGSNPVIDLNEGHVSASLAQEGISAQQSLSNEVMYNNAADNLLKSFELGGEEGEREEGVANYEGMNSYEDLEREYDDMLPQLSGEN